MSPNRHEIERASTRGRDPPTRVIRHILLRRHRRFGESVGVQRVAQRTGLSVRTGRDHRVHVVRWTHAWQHCIVWGAGRFASVSLTLRGGIVSRQIGGENNGGQSRDRPSVTRRGAS
jgi:hypothetical protein